MTKTEVCEALERAAATVEESGLLAFVRRLGDVRDICNHDAKLLRTLKARLEGGSELDFWCDEQGELHPKQLVIDWSPEGSDKGEAG